MTKRIAILTALMAGLAHGALMVGTNTPTSIRVGTNQVLFARVGTNLVWQFADPYLVAWYKLDGNALDSSTNLAHGAWTGTPVYAAGQIDQAAKFSGIERIDAGAKVPLTGDFTVSAWVNIQTHSTSYLLNQTDVTGAGRFLITDTANSKISFRIGAGSVELTSPKATGAWLHLTMTRISGTCRAYVDCVLTGVPFENANALPDLVLQIGGTDRLADRNSISTIDEVRIYNRGLSSNDVCRVRAGLTPIHD